MQKMVKMYQDGRSLEFLSKKFLVSVKSVRNTLVNSGVRIRTFGEGRKIKDELIVKIMNEYQKSEVSLSTLQRKYGVSMACIAYSLRKRGIPVRTIRTYSDSERADVVFKYQQGMSSQDLADQYGTSPSMILKILDGAGVKCSKTRKRKRAIPYKKDGVTLAFKSSYEVFYAEYLDSKNIAWVYEPRAFEISGRWTYTPDFLLVDSSVYVDVKGYDYPKQSARIKMFQEKYPEIKFTVLFGQDLSDLGIDLNRRHRWQDLRIRINSGPSSQECGDDNSVNSVDTLWTGKQRAIPSQAATVSGRCNDYPVMGVGLKRDRSAEHPERMKI